MTAKPAKAVTCPDCGLVLRVADSQLMYDIDEWRPVASASISKARCGASCSATERASPTAERRTSISTGNLGAYAICRGGNVDRDQCRLACMPGAHTSALLREQTSTA
jgi:hypothetical protein